MKPSSKSHLASPCAGGSPPRDAHATQQPRPSAQRLAIGLLTAVLLSLAPTHRAQATLVALTTPLGEIRVELYEDKPVTVANFLAYINAGRYGNSFAHRLVPGFVLQGGGFTLQGNSVTPVTTFAPIVNEYGVGQTRSNILGTIAMAKLGGDPNSATSQWFFNLGDNSANLDTQNGGFTVFGDVVAGLDVLTLFNTTFNQAATGGRGVYNASGALGSGFQSMPLLAGALTTGNLIHTEWSVAPEPTTALLLLGSGAMLLLRRRRASAQ
jgi:cyclophilin family peptidyl-prolyl cis-trans isomerase